MLLGVYSIERVCEILLEGELKVIIFCVGQWRNQREREKEVSIKRMCIINESRQAKRNPKRMALLPNLVARLLPLTLAAYI